MQVDPEDYPEWLRDLHNSSPVESLYEETKSLSRLDDAAAPNVTSKQEAGGLGINSSSGTRESSERHSSGKEEEQRTVSVSKRSKPEKGKGKGKGRLTSKQLALDAINGKPYCMQCGATKTPLWRTFGKDVLCNACGLRRMRAKTPFKNKKRKKKNATAFKRTFTPKSHRTSGSFTVSRSALREEPSDSQEHPVTKGGDDDHLDSCENQFVRRGKRKRKASVWLQDQWDNQAEEKQYYRKRYNDSSEDKPGSSTGLDLMEEDMEESMSAQEACKVLASMDQMNVGESLEKEEALEDGEFDLILKLHDVYGPSTQSLYSQSIRRKETNTLLLAIALRATLNLFSAKKIDQSEKLFLIDKISSDKEDYLRSLPLATDSYEELEDLLYHFLSRNRNLTKSREDAIPNVEKKVESNQATEPAEDAAKLQLYQSVTLPNETIQKEAETFRSPPPLLLIPKSVELSKNSQSPLYRSFQLNTPTIEEPRPPRSFE